MKKLLSTTEAYRRIRSDAEKGELASTTLVLFPDAANLRQLLISCAKAFFLAEEGTRTALLLEKESYSDCLFYPEAGGKLTADGAGEIVEESLLRPVEGERKLLCVLLDGATPLVQNKLLKVLEEPPESVYFLLGASAEHAVLPTVLSRAKKIAEPPFPEPEVVRALERLHPGEKGIREAAAAGGGILSVSESLLSDGGEEFALAENFLLSDAEKLCRTLGEEKVRRPFLPALKLVLRDALFLATGQEKYCMRRTEGVKKISVNYPAGALVSAIGFAGDAEREIAFNANYGQALYTLSVRVREERKKW